MKRPENLTQQKCLRVTIQMVSNKTIKVIVKLLFLQINDYLSFSSGKRIAIVGQNNIPSLKKKDVQEEVDKGNPNYIPIIGLMGRLWIMKQLFVSGVEYPPLAGVRKNVTPSDDHDFAMYILKVTSDWKKDYLTSALRNQ